MSSKFMVSPSIGVVAYWLERVFSVQSGLKITEFSQVSFILKNETALAGGTEEPFLPFRALPAKALSHTLSHRRLSDL